MPADFPLSSRERDYVERLWKSQTRQVVNAIPSRELETKSSSVVSKQDVGFIGFLHEFFVAHLHLVLGQSHPSQRYLKYNSSNPSWHSSSSCLGAYVRLALRKKTVTLWEGRRVVVLHHEEFSQELNHFMLAAQGVEYSEEWSHQKSFGAKLHFHPHPALAALGVAMRLALVTVSQSTTTTTTQPQQVTRFLDASQLQVRFIHMTSSNKIPMMDIKTGSVGKLVTVKGHVVKAKPKRLRIATSDFTCTKCGSSILHAFTNGKYSTPTKCTNSECKSRSFAMSKTQANYYNVQEIRLQEAQEESTLHSGRTPRQMPVELSHELVDSCRPGDTVLVACIVDTINSAVAAGRTGKRAKETSTYTLILLGHSITTLSETNNSNRRGTTQQQQFSQQQLQCITQLCHADHKYFGMTERRAFPFDLLVRSLCPAIVGHHEVKAGILLCLLGGTPPTTTFHATRNNSTEIRSNSHILIVGDPGMGKSQMLLAACQLAARSVYVGGNTASTTGLTVTLTKEEGGEAGMEAGALVLADNGMCVIDEFDKMASQKMDGLLEAMEQQQVSIAKAGVVASLPARCSVVAAANPKHGSYNMNKTVAENLNMSKPILSRFDLVFILRDRADENLDRLVSSNIMNLYRKPGSSSSSTNSNTGGPRRQQQSTPPPQSYTQQGVEPTHPTSGGQDRIPIWERLAWVADIQKTPLPADLVRDYIAYAREYCKPKLTPEAAQVLQEYYLQLRYPAHGPRRQDTVPITTRQLEAMIRLSQARAKACLREFVIEGDALDVVELMRKSVDQVHSDESGWIDPSRGGAGGMSNRKLRKLFETKVKEIIGLGATCSMDDLRNVAGKMHLGLSEFQPAVEYLREKGVLLFKSDGRFQVV